MYTTKHTTKLTTKLTTKNTKRTKHTERTHYKKHAPDAYTPNLLLHGNSQNNLKKLDYEKAKKEAEGKAGWYAGKPAPLLSAGALLSH